jgi:chromosome segregation ATPase
MPAGNEMSEKLDRLSGTLINAILGALILWVGQTTFRHAGLLAGVDEKLVAVKEQFAAVDKRQEGLRKWLESAVTDMKDNTRLQFTLKDGERLATQLRQAEAAANELERRLAERMSALDLRLTALEARHRGSQESATLQIEVAQLRGELARLAAYAQQLQPEERFAHGTPVFLPPVTERR